VETNTIKEIEILKPVFKENYTAIAMSSSDEYIPYLSVCLQSLVEHTDNNHNYDIVIFSSSKNEINKQLIIDTYSRDNISIRFYNPSAILNEVKMTVTHSYFHEACYYRIVAPTVMPDYSKVIFTDIDLIFNSDIQELYSIDISEHPIAACREPIWVDFIDNNSQIHNINIKKYSIEVLKLNDIRTYFNTGVMLINIDLFKSYNYFDDLKKLINENFFLYQEQDALNTLFTNKILPIDKIWNLEITPRNKEIRNTISQGKIIHYLGGKKPWNYPEEMYSNIWWQYARKTPYYELILKRMNLGINNSIRCAFQYRKNIIEYWKFKVLSKITFGQLRKNYKQKRNILKNKIWIAKNIRGIN